MKIVGSGNIVYRKYCKKLVDQLGLSSAVSFIDAMPRSELLAMYQSSDVFCMPSIETYGIAILEAMSCACSVLVSDINGPGEIVQAGVGLKIPLQTPDVFISEYADQLVTLIESPNVRAELGNAARQHVVKHHDWNDIQARLVEIYDEAFLSAKAHAPNPRELLAT
jgi:glycosyltransferase involved in cell wall biosynthesis